MLSIFLIGVIVIIYFIFCFGAPLDFAPFKLESESDSSTLTFALLLALHSLLPILLTFGADTLESAGLVQVGTQNKVLLCFLKFVLHHLAGF